MQMGRRGNCGAAPLTFAVRDEPFAESVGLRSTRGSFTDIYRAPRGYADRDP